MQKAQDSTSYFFVDESGDPTFYDRHGNLVIGTEGTSKILILGFIHTRNPKAIRQSLQNLQQVITQDKYLEGIPSLQKTLISFHAKDDSPEIREKVFKAIVNLDFTAELFVGRKIQNIFNARHHRNENEFYNDLISKLFENKLHLAKHNEIFFAVRGSKTRQIPLEHAIQKAISTFEGKWKKKVRFPCVLQKE